MKLIQQLRIPYQKDPDLKQWVARQLQISLTSIDSIQVVKRSLDARNPRRHFWVYTLKVFVQGEQLEPDAEAPFSQLNWKGAPPLIIGAGPAGLFAAWTFLAHGIRPILLERGDRTHRRMLKISQYWRQGILDPDSNVCYGEGGAGLFSDGKLMTRIKSPLIAKVMRALVDYGAPAEITQVYNPHVGSNLIREVIKKMTNSLIARGAEMRFNTRVESLYLEQGQVKGLYLQDGSCLEGNGVILACGHGAGDFFRKLFDQGVSVEPKPFAVGLRIEHPQNQINRWQYGRFAAEEALEAAQYKLSYYWDQEQIGVYTFCMCPGGYIVSSSTNEGSTVVNGMSNYHRNSPWANAAVVCSVDVHRVSGNHPFKMLEFQNTIEHQTYEKAAAVGKPWRVPAQRLEDFLYERLGSVPVKSSCPSGIVAADLTTIFPAWITQHLQAGLLQFERKRRGFLSPDAVLHAVESRTSSPIRVPRDSETLESLNTPGLFPCGEGPGYAGGITSAAVDGMKAALAWIKKFAN